MPPQEVHLQDVSALLARWLPACAVTITRMGAGVSTPVYRVTIDDQVSYLRLAEAPGERRDAEMRAHELIRDLGISVPGIIRWERAPPELDRSAILTSRIPGIPLAEFTGDAPGALYQVGCDLARINAMPVVGYGWVDRVVGADRHLVATHPLRPAWAEEYLAAAQTVIAEAIPHVPATTLRRALGEWTALPEAATAFLAHGDFDNSHIYVDPVTGAYQGLIDFGEIRGADRCYDLGQLLLSAGEDTGQRTFDRVAAGYASVAPFDLAAVRLQAIAIATRALAIQLGRPPNAWRAFLQARLAELLGSTH